MLEEERRREKVARTLYCVTKMKISENAKSTMNKQTQNLNSDYFI